MKKVDFEIRQPGLRHLMMLPEIARSTSISECSERLFLSKSAIASALKEMERQLAHRLFQRSSRGISATPEGAAFAKRCERATRHLGQFQRVALGSQKNRPIHRLLSDSQLRALIAVTRSQNYSVAAHQTGLAQPSLHRSVRELEDLLGQQLFRRAGRGVEATRLARNLSRSANLAYSEIQQGLDELQFARGVQAGQLRIGCLPMARTDLLPETLTKTLEHYPDARISVVDGPYNEQLAMLLHGELDAIIGALRDPLPTTELLQKLLFRDALGVIVRAGHPITRRGELSLRDLAELAWIVPRQDTPTRKIFDRMLGKHMAYSTSSPIECSSMVAIRGLLLRTDRAALISVSQMRHELEAGQVTRLPVRLPEAERNIGYSVRSDWQPTRLQQDFLIQLNKYRTSTDTGC